MNYNYAEIRDKRKSRTVKKGIILPQWFTGLGVTLLLFHIGLIGGWTSPTLALLRGPNSPMPLNENQESWVAALVNFSRFFGGIFGPLATDFLGSKKSILVTSLPISIGWFLISIADSVEWLYLARLANGLGLGMAFATFPLYIGEVSMPEIRGALISLATVGAPVGQVVASICGSYMSMSLAAGIYFVLGLFLIGLFIWLPESPHHLVKCGQNEAARRSIAWYRAGVGVQQELEAVEKFVASSTGFFQKLEALRTPVLRRAIYRIIALYSLMQVTGLNIVMFFMETILKRAGFNLVEPSLIVIIANVGCTLSALLSIVLIEKCGRKILLVISSAGTTLSMLGLMTYFFLSEPQSNGLFMQWLPAASMVLFMTSFFIGLLPVPSAILSELFPANIKSVAACIAILTGAIMSFLSAKTYHPLLNLVGDAYVFMIYAAMSAFIIPYTLFFLMETKGKSLQQIQDELVKK